MSIDDTVRETRGPGPQRVPSDPVLPGALGVPATDELGRSGEPGAPVAPLAGATPTTGAGRSPTEAAAAPDDLVTRLLCATTYLRESFADAVAGDLVRPRLTAMAPLWQVDAVRLVQHARRARASRRQRDRWLAAVLGCLLLTILGLGRVHQLSPVTLLVLGFALLLWVYGCSVALLARQYLWARKAAVAAAYGPDDTDPEVAPPSLDLALKDLNEANVVFFDAESSPFLGSGDVAGQWTLTIDLSRGLVNNTGTRKRGREHKPPVPFTGAELQEYLLRSMPPLVDPRPSAGHRLHVRGGTTAPLVELFRIGPTDPEPIEAVRFRRPVPRVPEALVRHYLHEPSEAARVYTYFQHSAWGGQLILTLFVRAMVSNRTLVVEGELYALRPLDRVFYEVRGLSQRPAVELMAAIRLARPEAVTQLLTSPIRVWQALQNSLRPAEIRRMDREIAGRRDVDLGAHESLRERAATTDDLIDHFPAIDERMYHQILNRRVLECIGDFLASKNIDPGEFVRQQSVIVARPLNFVETRNAVDEHV